ncbi:protein phosphatase 2C [Purpureocillium lilacinum]|uniref:Protein phosphatase 2C homolog 2 n=1 Tax=Purpureocillium lilacinum TaxID=33203 RepID=A0A179G9T6_PURLI|nr:protein phosphatase 2C [Purpureocillium lilacinum]
MVGLPVMDIATNEESRAYPLSWGSSGFDDPANFTDLPSADHALYLINGLKFHVGQLYHLYDESHFMKPFHDFYSAPAEVARENRIWYVQFLTLLGLAKALVVQPSRQGAVLPGTDLFLRAMSLLPDTPYLFSDALTSVETLCAISIYLQCADLRNSAYIHDVSLTTSEIGTALRVAVTFGLHRERPTQDWGPSITERCQRVWWTVYVLDRTFSSSMGVPISIQDADITTTMPSRDGARDSMTLYVHVKLSNLISEVVNKVYGAEGRLRSSFLPCVHKVLERIASIASDLNACFPLSYDGSDGGISRVSSHLHLFYHQTSDKGEDDRLIYGLSAMQGWRISMEDSHTAVLDLGNPNSTDPKKHPDHLSFFGVFDGHGGDKVALFAGENIHKIIAKQDSFKNGDYSRGLQDGFLATDRAILNDPKYEEEVSGCTACVSLIAGNKLYVANAGDSRGVLGIKGRAKPMSQDHKPQLEAEKNRITAAGGFVDFGRVNGNLALSRAIGDFEFKKSADLSPENQIVTAFPDVDSHDLTDEDEFLVLACDGIWDCQSSQAVVEFVRRGIAAKQDLDKICENMMDNCLASNSETGGVGCDNMTMVIIGFLHGKTKEEWYEEIARRVANGDGPCAPPEYAEFRGPGVHHNYEDSDSGYEMDAENKGKSFGVGGYRGRIIFLGDGTEVLTDSDDTEMFDNTDEDKDLESQVSKNASTDGSSAPQPASEASATETKPETEAAKPSESETAPSKQEKSESEDKKD